MPSEVLELFTELAAIPSPPGDERAVADAVVRNSAGTILGADNKSAVAVMLDATRRVLSENRPHSGIELLFTPKEEVGLLGAAAFDHERLQARVCYVYDQAAPIGDVILGAPYSQALEVTFHGRAAHSGMYPEEGRSAIAAAARAVADLRLGRVDDETVVRIAHSALERAGYTPSYGLSGGAADANIFNERGLACLNLANGMQDIHTPDERITVDDLEGMVEVTLALVEVARDADA